MNQLIQHQNIRFEKLPVLSDLLFGKIFDYMYTQKTNVKEQIIDCAISMLGNLELCEFKCKELNKNELLLERTFSKTQQLEQELLFLQNHSQISFKNDYSIWKIQMLPCYPNGYAYCIKLIIKENIEIDTSLLSQKLQLYHKLEHKLIHKITEKRRKI